jgi:hypothetical protein
MDEEKKTHLQLARGGAIRFIHIFGKVFTTIEENQIRSKMYQPLLLPHRNAYVSTDANSSSPRKQTVTQRPHLQTVHNSKIHLFHSP